jgi:cytochrome c oxidase cbb3-type subunit 3
MKGYPLVLLMVGTALLGGCRKASPDVLASGAPVPVPTAVGPIPGPDTKQSAAQTNPFANDRAAAGEGRRLFNRFNCSGCHGDHGGGGMGPSLRDEDWLYGNGDDQIFSSIIEGRAHGMPTWGPRISADQTWQLVTYIKAMRTSSEPQPPT